MSAEGAAEDDPRRIDLGRPGASARAEFERRLRQDSDRRRRRYGRLLAPVVASLAGTRPSTDRWRVGSEAEERVGRLLDRAVGGAGFVLHDRSVPHGRANLDHVAVVASGVWVIDTKRTRGPVRRARAAGRRFGRRTLVVNGRDRRDLVAAAHRQRNLVRSVAGPGTAVRAVLCFADVAWGRHRRQVWIEGVLITRPKALARVLTAGGPLGPGERLALATRIAGTLPPHPAGLPLGAAPGGRAVSTRGEA
jgi:hypothetical protein